ncbi:MAG: helix-turn-helix transcriptional regulator [Chloroflexales bacterium]
MVEIYSFGEWVRRKRKALDLTQDHLASRVGCSKVLISKIETDERRPSKEIATLLAAALELEPDDQPAFVQAARAELATDRLPLPTTHMPNLSLIAPMAAPSPTPPAQPTPEPPLTLVVAENDESDLPPVSQAANPAREHSLVFSEMWIFWMWWAIATTVGWGLGRVLGWYVGSNAYVGRVIDLGDGSHLFGAGLAFTLDTIIIGVPGAVLQAFILRHRLANARWWVIMTLLAWVLVGVPGRLFGDGGGGVLTGIALGVAQWRVLRHSAHAGWWIPISMCGWAPLWIANSMLNVAIYNAIGGTMSGIVYERGAGWAITLLLSSALVGSIQGVYMGGMLAWILRAKTALPRATVDCYSPQRPMRKP